MFYIHPLGVSLARAAECSASSDVRATAIWHPRLQRVTMSPPRSGSTSSRIRTRSRDPVTASATGIPPTRRTGAPQGALTQRGDNNPDMGTAAGRAPTAPGTEPLSPRPAASRAGPATEKAAGSAAPPADSPSGDHAPLGDPSAEYATVEEVTDALRRQQLVIEKMTNRLLAEAHQPVLDEVGTVKARVSILEDQEASLADEVRLLRKDVNSILEYMKPRDGDYSGEQPRLSPPRGQSAALGGSGRGNRELHDRLDIPPSGDEEPEIRDKSSRRRRSRRHGTSRRSPRHGDSSPSSGSRSSSRSTASSEDSYRRRKRGSRSRNAGRGGVHLRRKGHRHRHLRVLRPSNHLYDVAVDYRYYRLQRRSSSRSGRETGKVKDHVRRMATAASDLRFDGSDPISVLEFLARFVEEADILEMKESQALLALSYFLRKDALAQFRAAQSSSPEEGGIRYWPEAVQYLLRNYATDNAISAALLELRDMKQKTSEDEMTFSARLMAAEVRCGNIHSTEEKMTLFIDGLQAGVRPLVSRYREAERAKSRTEGGFFTYLDLVRFAQNEGEAYRARNPRLAERHAERRGAGATANRRAAPPPSRGRSLLLLDDSSEDSRILGAELDRLNQHEDGVFLLPEGGTVATDELPSSMELDAESSDPALLVQSSRGRVMPAPRVPQMGERQRRTTRPGWVDANRPRGAPQGRQGARSGNSVVCYRCYEHGHVAPDCPENLQGEPARVLDNYARLPGEVRDRIPADSYWRARALQDILTRTNASPQQARPPVGDTAFPNPPSRTPSATVRESTPSSGTGSAQGN